MWLISFIIFIPCTSHTIIRSYESVAMAMRNKIIAVLFIHNNFPRYFLSFECILMPSNLKHLAGAFLFLPLFLSFLSLLLVFTVNVLVVTREYELSNLNWIAATSREHSHVNQHCLLRSESSLTDWPWK